MEKKRNVYMDRNTGEIFENWRDAYAHFEREYDGGDPTNGVDFWDCMELVRG